MTDGQKRPPEKFYKLPMVLAERRDVSASAKLLFSVIQDRTGRHETCWPGVRTLAKDCGLNPSTIEKSIKALERAGMLVVQRRGWPNESEYRVTEPDVWKTHTCGKSTRAEKPCRDVRKSHTHTCGKTALNQTDQLNQTKTRSLDDEAKGILAAYAEVKPAGLDQSRGRAKGHIVKLLVKHSAEKLLRAVANYRAEVEAAGTEPKYRRGCGNFFGRDGDWQTYADSGWTLPAEASDDEPPPLDPEMIEALESRAAGGGR